MITIKNCVNFISDSNVCAIPDPDNEEVIITGGRYTKTTVSVYNKMGHQRDMASLNTGRRLHACTSFIYENTKVYLLNDGRYFNIFTVYYNDAKKC